MVNKPLIRPAISGGGGTLGGGWLISHEMLKFLEQKVLRLQICLLYIFGNKLPQMGFYGSKYW